MMDRQNADPWVGVSFFDNLADSWDKLAVHPPERVEFVLATIGVREGYRVLDVGCGTGILSPWLSQAVGPSGKVVAVDLSPRMIALAREKRRLPNVEYRVVDFLDLAPADGRFDLVMVYSAFPHFFDRTAFFAKAVSLLEPGGLLAIAHIESRATINAFHDRAGLLSLDLSPVEELAAQAGDLGFRTVLTRDDDYYIFVAQAPGGA
jgi:ubiquinone/menaquinone biosynthesis C-methylase UbiE